MMIVMMVSRAENQTQDERNPWALTQNVLTRESGALLAVIIAGKVNFQCISAITNYLGR